MVLREGGDLGEVGDADHLVLAGQFLQLQGDKIGDSDKKPLQDAIARVRDKAKGEDTAAIKSAIQELEAASHAMSEALYKSTAAGAGAASDTGTPHAGAEGAAADDDTIDAEFEVKEG